MTNCAAPSTIFAAMARWCARIATASAACSTSHELEVSDVMVHRTNMRSVNADNPPEAVVREILQSPHTRMPLWKGSLDNIVGVLHAKDLLRALNDVGNDFSRIDVMKIASKPWFVPDTTTLQEQLNAFLRRKAHFAIVVDEYGEVEGLVTLEDIIEEIVGEIADEHDVDIQGVKQEADGSVVVDGTVPIRDLNRALDWNLPDEEATTIAGLVIHETQSIPEEKQAFTFHGKRFIVMKRDKNRITRIRIRPAASSSRARISNPDGVPVPLVSGRGQTDAGAEQRSCGKGSDAVVDGLARCAVPLGCTGCFPTRLRRRFPARRPRRRRRPCCRRRPPWVLRRLTASSSSADCWLLLAVRGFSRSSSSSGGLVGPVGLLRCAAFWAAALPPRSRARTSVIIGSVWSTINICCCGVR